LLLSIYYDAVHFTHVLVAEDPVGAVVERVGFAENENPLAH